MKKKCIIVGAGTYGQVYAEYLKRKYDIVGFIDDDESLIGKTINSFKVLGGFNYLLSEMDKSISVFVPIGDNDIRERMLNELKENGFSTPNFIHPTANIDSSVKIAKSAVYVLQGTTIMPKSELKAGVMISSGTVVSHHTVIGPHVFISFGVNVAASTTVKNKAYLGVGCTIMTGVKRVGRKSLIGAGSVIIRDVPNYAVMVGNPGKVLRYVSKGSSK